MKALKAMMVTSLLVLSVGSAEASQEFGFRFEKSGRQPGSAERFDYKATAGSWEEAFKVAAHACFRHFKDGRRLNESEGLDIIDVCANPRRID